MKQNITVQRSPRRRAASSRGPITIGLDLGDRSSRYCLLDGQGDVVQEASAATTKKGMQVAFGARPRCRIAIEVGAHSPWVSRLLAKLGGRSSPRFVSPTDRREHDEAAREIGERERWRFKPFIRVNTVVGAHFFLTGVGGRQAKVFWFSEEFEHLWEAA
jgi:hypothetical protein